MTLFWIDMQAVGQQTTSEVYAKEIVENNFIITDRDVYCVNEYIRFRVWNRTDNSITQVNWSNVLYVELITPSGVPVVRKKFNYKNDGTNGIIYIPSETLTGNYYLKIYTKWMRNFSPETYCYKLITIINSSCKALLLPSKTICNLNYLFQAQDFSDDIAIQTNKTHYSKRERVEVKLELSPSEIQRDAAITVAKKKYYNHTNFKLEHTMGSGFNLELLPETRKLSLSGNLISQKDSTPMPHHRVNLTIFKSTPEILSTVSQKDGSFYFDLSELYGEYETFISIGSGYKKHMPIIQIDNDYSTEEISLPYIPLDTFQQRQIDFNELSLNAQIQYLYKNENISSAVSKAGSNTIFYGEPDLIIEFDRFIDLPTLEDYFHELVNYVAIRIVDGEKQFKILGKQANIKLNDPLIMVDMVAISDIEEILKISPRLIARIEVINESYQRGSLIYGGIISIISKSGNIAGINLPSTGRFFEFSMYDDQVLKSRIEHANKRIPDTRNCLYWNPSIVIEPGVESGFIFSTGDTSGEYEIVISGFNSKGKLTTSVQNFIVD